MLLIVFIPSNSREAIFENMYTVIHFGNPCTLEVLLTTSSCSFSL